MYDPIPGRWYLVYLCKGCHQKQILFPDLTDGKSKLNASYVVRCPRCHHEDSYDSEHIERYQHPETAKRAVA